MSSSYKNSLKEMRKEKHKATHQTNVRRSEGKSSTLDNFANEVISSTVDGFTKLSVHKPVEERCANPRCRKIIVGAKYTLTVKGKEDVYCQPCAKQILHPQENMQEV